MTSNQSGLKLYIIYLRDGRMLVSKKVYSSWREIQDEYEAYMTSLGPWTVEAVLDYLRTDYPDSADRMREAVMHLESTPEMTCEIQ